MAMIHFGGNSYTQCCQLVLEVDHKYINFKTNLIKYSSKIDLMNSSVVQF